MKVKEIREEMKRRGITVVQIQHHSGYSASFTSRIMNDMGLDSTGLPKAIRQTLEMYGIIEPVILPPTERQLECLKRAGYQGTPASRDEATQLIGELIAQKNGTHMPVVF